jgi:pyruvate/2-oxoglutarate dehydrogenase complex dihydrolipoamide acyltransferase (E2) component
MHPSNSIGNFEEREFPDVRNPTIDILILGSKRHHVPVLIEIDVTTAREVIHARKKDGDRLSFTGWIVKCIARAVSEHPSIHALWKGKRRLVIFEDVDVAAIVERKIDRSSKGETLPMPYIIRQANRKNVVTITSEIRTAQQSPVGAGEVQIGSARAAWMTKIATMLPRFVRNWLFWRRLFRNPFLFKRLMGTVSVTALGMKSQGGMSWGIPIGIHPLIIAVGAIAKRPNLVDDRVVMRECVGLTVLFDHDMTDGAPIARFIKRLEELMTSAYGLREMQE